MVRGLIVYIHLLTHFSPIPISFVIISLPFSILLHSFLLPFNPRRLLATVCPSPLLRQHVLSLALRRCSSDVDRALVYVDIASLALDMASTAALLAADQSSSSQQSSPTTTIIATTAADLSTALVNNVKVFREAIEQARVCYPILLSAFYIISYRCVFPL